MSHIEEGASLPYGDDRLFGEARFPTLSVASLSPTERHQMWLLMNAAATSGLTAGTTPDIFSIIHTPNDVSAKVDGTPWRACSD